jgi:hypothetical protein
MVPVYRYAVLLLKASELSCGRGQLSPVAARLCAGFDWLALQTAVADGSSLASWAKCSDRFETDK